MAMSTVYDSMTSVINPPMPVAQATAFPTAGIGGQYYSDPSFEVPVYSDDARRTLNWQMIDAWNQLSLNYAIGEGVAAGLVWATIIYLLALTPSRKRTTAFHSFLLAGLVFMLMHLMMDLISIVTPGLSTSSAYVVLTRDISSSIWTTRYTAVYAATRVANWLAFVFASICLWLQAKTLMTGLKVRFPTTYYILLTYLALTSLAVLIASMVYWIYQITVIQDDITYPVFLPQMLRNIYLIIYAISIGSFSVINVCSVVNIIWRRPSSVLTPHNAYHSALNLLGLLGAQSFIVPRKSHSHHTILPGLILTDRYSHLLHPPNCLHRQPNDTPRNHHPSFGLPHPPSRFNLHDCPLNGLWQPEEGTGRRSDQHVPAKAHVQSNEDGCAQVSESDCLHRHGI
jgi:hypothetical protein